MSITADVRSIYFGPDSGRSANIRYSIADSGDTGPCWFRGAYVSTFASVYPNYNYLFSFHDGPTGETLITMGVGSWAPNGFLLMGEECYIDVPETGIYISSTLEEFIRETMITFFIS